MKPIRHTVVIAVLVLTSAPTLATTLSKLTPAETKAAAILRDVDAASKKHRTMTADFEVLNLAKSQRAEDSER